MVGSQDLFVAHCWPVAKNAVICLCAHGHAQSEGTGWGAVWNCYAVAAYELTQMVSPSATVVTHLHHWARERRCLCVSALASNIHVYWQSLTMGLRTLSHTFLLPSIAISEKKSGIFKLLWLELLPRLLNHTIVSWTSPAKDGNWSCGLLTKAGLIAKKILRQIKTVVNANQRNGIETKHSGSFHHHFISRFQQDCTIHPAEARKSTVYKGIAYESRAIHP